MFEIDLRIRNDLPFCILSDNFPEVTVYRWCNSGVDYLEFHGRDSELQEVERNMELIAKSLGTHLLQKSSGKNRLSAMFSCKCSKENSTIRIVESMNCLWHAPVTYRNGNERIRAISLDSEGFAGLYDWLEKIGEVEIERKAPIVPESLKDFYVIPISSVLGELTGKQLAVIRDAIGNGYFSSPRRITLEQLSSSNEISESTVQEHLSKGLNKIMRAMESYVNLMIEYRNSTPTGRRE